MIVMLLADGFEEVEALTPLDLLRRAALDVKTVGVTGKVVRGAHGISVTTDLSPEEVDFSSVRGVVLPGGMPGTKNLDASPFTDSILSAVSEKGGLLAAICAAPSVLGKRGYLNGRYATCYPGFEDTLKGATHKDEPVVPHLNTVTAKGMGVAFEFGIALVRYFVGEEKAEAVRASTMAEAGKNIPLYIF